MIIIMMCDGSVMVTSTSQRQYKHRYKCSILTHLIFPHYRAYDMRLDRISSSLACDNIHFLIMSYILYQYSFTAFHWAAEYGRTEVMRLFLDNGADINIRNKVSDMI